MKILFLIFLTAFVAFSADSSKYDNLLRDLAVAQRNYAGARAKAAETAIQLQQALERASSAADEARKVAEVACQKEGKTLDAQAAACIEKPKK